MAPGRLVCDLCGRDFDRLGMLIRHRERRHRLLPDETRYSAILVRLWVCPEDGCEATLTQSGSFYRHLWLRHGIEPFLDEEDEED